MKENLVLAGPLQSAGVSVGFLVGFSGYTVIEPLTELATFANFALVMTVALAIRSVEPEFRKKLIFSA